MRSFQTSAVLACILAIPSTVFADFSYQQTTQITGGSMLSMIKMAGALSSQARKAGEPVVTSVYLKGNRLPMSPRKASRSSTSTRRQSPTSTSPSGPIPS